VLLRRMSVTHHHIDFRVPEHGCQRYKVNSGHGCSGGRGVAEVIKAEGRNHSLLLTSCVPATGLFLRGAIGFLLPLRKALLPPRFAKTLLQHFGQTPINFRRSSGIPALFDLSARMQLFRHESFWLIACYAHSLAECQSGKNNVELILREAI
jgi:hypothetical protein